jgi:hypothetical protein
MKKFLLSSIFLAASFSPCHAQSSVPDNKAPTSPNSWRNRYELGPGDVVNFSLFGRPDLDRPGFRIAPDGTVSFLQAQNIKVTGLSLDEARIAIESGLQSHFRSPRVIITPQEVASKRFTILGKILKRGVVIRIRHQRHHELGEPQRRTHHRINFTECTARFYPLLPHASSASSSAHANRKSHRHSSTHVRPSLPRRS